MRVLTPIQIYSIACAGRCPVLAPTRRDFAQCCDRRQGFAPTSCADSPPLRDRSCLDGVSRSSLQVATGDLFDAFECDHGLLCRLVAMDSCEGSRRRAIRCVLGTSAPLRSNRWMHNSSYAASHRRLVVKPSAQGLCRINIEAQGAPCSPPISFDNRSDFPHSYRFLPTSLRMDISSCGQEVSLVATRDQHARSMNRSSASSRSSFLIRTISAFTRRKAVQRTICSVSLPKLVLSDRQFSFTTGCPDCSPLSRRTSSEIEHRCSLLAVLKAAMTCFSTTTLSSSSSAPRTWLIIHPQRGGQHSSRCFKSSQPKTCTAVDPIGLMLLATLQRQL